MKPIKHFLMVCALFVAHRTCAVESNVFNDIATGSAAAVVEVAVDQPLIYFKNMVQQGKSISMDPRILWRGAPGNAASLAPVTAIQVVGNNALLEWLKQRNKNVTISAQMGAAFGAGALSGLVSCPSENVMLEQQNSGVTLYSSMNNILKSHGTRGMFRALAATMMRDGGFSAGLLGLRPIIKKKLKQHSSNEAMLTVGSGVIAGVIAGVVTHPFDTVKTTMQANLQDKKSASTFKVLARILRQNSARGLFKGLTARSTRVISAITLMGYVTDTLSAMLKN